MAFVAEFVPEADKARFADKNVWKISGSDWPLECYTWVIDRERDIFLINVCGGGGDFICLCLVLKTSFMIFFVSAGLLL